MKIEYFEIIENSLKESANRKIRIRAIEERLRTNVDYNNLIKLRKEERMASNFRNKQNVNQIDVLMYKSDDL